MPRKIPTQVDQSISRLLKGGYLKQTPISYQTLLSYPPNSLPPRIPHQHSTNDGLPSTSSNATSSPLSRRYDSKKRSQYMPKLSPQPIVYLADRVRERFYQDHPWETLRPRTLVEGATLQDIKVPHPEATDLSAWGRNPGPEDVVACSIHLHKKHSLSLSQAYHHTLSSYHALRAEHEHASRSAVLEAKSYGAVFAVSSDGKPTAAVEIERGHRKEAEQVTRGANYFRSVYRAGSASAAAAAASSVVADADSGFTRVKSGSDQYSKGQLYLKAALEARDGKPEEVMEKGQTMKPDLSEAGSTEGTVAEPTSQVRVEGEKVSIGTNRQERI